MTELANDERLAAVLARLEASRSALRQELVVAPDTGVQGAGRDGMAEPLRRWWRRLRRASRRSALASLAAEALQGWWHRQPWRTPASLALGQLRPVVQQHPLACAGVAAALGAAIVLCRPWRWKALDAQLRPLPGRVGHWLLSELGHAPVQAALASLLLSALRASTPPPPAATGPAAARAGTDSLPAQQRRSPGLD